MLVKSNNFHSNHLARDEAVAVGAPDSEPLMVTLLTVGSTLVSHVLPMQQHLTRRALEAPDVILFIQSHQSLAIPELAPAASTHVL